MPELPTYTASGRIDPTPLQGQSIDAAMRPWEAVQRVGAEVGNVGDHLAILARDQRIAAAHKTKEDELTWTAKALSDFGRDVANRQRTDSQPEHLRETEGEEFDQFSKEKLTEYIKAAPSKRASDQFKMRAQALADEAWKNSSQRGEHTRLANVDKANTEAALNMSQAYRDFASTVGPEVAATTVAPLVSFQLASIAERFGKTAPTLALKMRLAVVEEMATSTAATNPDFARQLVDSSGITAESKLLLNNRIDSIQNSATALERSRFARTLQDNLIVAAKSGGSAPAIPEDEFRARFGNNWRIAKEEYDANRNDVNTASDLIRGLGQGVNPVEQAKAASDALKSGDPAKVKAAGTMRQAAEESFKLATTDPVAWQNQNDPDIQDALTTLSTLPDDVQAQFRSGVAYQRMARQGHPPPGDPHPERYLGHDYTHVLTAAEADRRKQQLASAPPDTKLRLLQDLETEFGDPVIANKVYSDLIELGDEKIPVTYRFASIINNVQTRKEFVDAQSNMKALDKLDDTTKKTYTDQLEKGPWRLFQAGWYGQSGEGVPDVQDAKSAIIAYAQHLHDGKGLDPKAAIDTAVQRVVSDNYGFATIHGAVLPIGRKRMDGGPDRTDAEIKDMERRLTVALKDVPVGEIQIKYRDGSTPFPNLSPSFDPAKPEDAQVVRDYITRNGFWVMDSSGEMVTLTIADGSRFGFALLDKNNKPLTVKLDDLPSYTVEKELTGRFGEQYTVKIPEAARETYPITTRSGIGVFGGAESSVANFLSGGISGLFPSSVSTNWPTRPAWMGKDTRNFRLE